MEIKLILLALLVVLVAFFVATVVLSLIGILVSAVVTFLLLGLTAIGAFVVWQKIRARFRR